MVKALLLVARWIAAAHDRWCEITVTRRPLTVEVAVLKERVERLRAENELLRARLGRLEPRRRPHDLPWERLAILWHQSRHRLSLAATARAFMVSVQTLLAWHRDAAEIERTLVDGRTPIKRASDVVAALALHLKREWPRWGTRRIAAVLARMGIAASRSTVQRILNRRGPPAPAQVQARQVPGPLLAKHPQHIWFLDFTRIGGFLRSVRVGAVLDAFSRKVLAIGVARREPSAAFAVTLMREAIQRHGPPGWVVTDKGKHNWLYLNELTTLSKLQDLIAFYVAQHNSKIPHAAFDGQTPDEMYRGAGAAVPERLAQDRAQARLARMEVNRARRCITCA